MRRNLTPLPPSRRGKGESESEFEDSSDYPSPRRRGARGEVPTQRIVVGQKVAPVKLQRAKELRRDMTPAERALWQHLRGNLLGFHFRRQQLVDGFIVDFYCHAARLVVEVDGDIHEQQRTYDEQRDSVLLRRGLRVLRIRNEEVQQNLAGVLARIARACGET